MRMFFAVFLSLFTFGANALDCSVKYADCMDVFCNDKNASGARCGCSNDITNLRAQYDKIESENKKVSANTALVIENIQNKPVPSNVRTRGANLSLWDTPALSVASSGNSIADLVGAAKFNSSDEMCREQMPYDCDIEMAVALYSKKINDDCTAFKNEISNLRKQLTVNKTSAQSAILTAAQNVYSEKLQLHKCIESVDDCMREDGACGANWERCTVSNIDSKRMYCESVLDTCRTPDTAWRDFVKNAKFSIERAEITREDRARQSCFTDVFTCARNACRDDIASAGEYTMDACLSRPDMAKSFCSVEIAQCDFVPGLWTAVSNELKSMRADACSDEVRKCFTAPNVCGEHFEKCVGLDNSALYKMCPIENIIVCKDHNADTVINQLNLIFHSERRDSCQKIADERFESVCGIGADCDGAYETNRELGTGSLMSESGKISGLINWGGITVVDGKIDVDAYVKSVPGSNKSALERVRLELENVNTEITSKINELENDSALSFCVNGRDLSQITGENRTTDAAYPNLTAGMRDKISRSVIVRATTNFKNKLADMESEMTQKSDIMTAEYNCYRLAYGADTILGQMGYVETSDLPKSVGANPADMEDDPFALVKTVATNVSKSDIASLAGRRVSNTVGAESLYINYELFATFNSQTRECTLCGSGDICGIDRAKIDEAKEKIKAVKIGGATAIAGGAVIGASLIAVGGLGSLVGAGMGLASVCAAFPVGTVVCAAAAVVAVVTAGVVAFVKSFEKFDTTYECEPLIPEAEQCNIIQM